MIKVMLVDDEAMVLEDTKRMIEWEKNGFVLVGALTNASAAWELYQRERPQIVITDICMPVMDGLELSERIFATGDVVQVLLLSSHENFRYAKSAMEVGVERYLLKHELDGGVLLQELRRAAGGLEEAWQARQLERQQLLRRLLMGDTDAAGHVRLLGGGDYWLLAFCARQEGEHPPMTDHSMRSSLQEKSQFSPGSAVIALEEGGLVFLLPLGVRQDGGLEGGEALLGKVAAFLKAHAYNEYMLLYEIVRTGDTQLHERYVQWRLLSVYTFFFDAGKPHCHRMSELAAQCTEAPEAPEGFLSLLEEVQRSVDTLDQEALVRQLDTLFALCAKKPWSYQTAIWLSARLDSLCSRLSHPQDGVESLPLPDQAAVGELRWRKLSDMRAHYNACLLELLEKRRLLGSTRYSRNLVLAMGYIRRHYSEDLSLDQVAAATSISGVYLSQLFKRETGQTFVEYLTAHRIEMSKKLLREGNHKIYRVSEMVGFNSNQYFSQVFRKATGLSPLDYREANR